MNRFFWNNRFKLLVVSIILSLVGVMFEVRANDFLKEVRRHNNYMLREEANSIQRRRNEILQQRNSYLENENNWRSTRDHINNMQRMNERLERQNRYLNRQIRDW